MQRCLEKGQHWQQMALADIIINSMHKLVEDPFGNYLVSYVLKLGDDSRNSRIFAMIASNFVKFSKQKFSSNVIEKVSPPD